MDWFKRVSTRLGANRRNGILFATGLVAGVVITLPGCSTLPVQNRNVMTISREPPRLNTNDLRYDSTLQIRWLGTAAFSIQMGDALIVTDPYFTPFRPFRTLAGPMKPDPALNEAKAALIHTNPLAIFVGHAHYDHILDAVELLKAGGWTNAPLYGSETATNIVHGLAGGEPSFPMSTVVTGTTRLIGTAGGVTVKYRAFPVKHAPHLGCITLFKGTVDRLPAKPPQDDCDFPDGGVYVFDFEFSSQSATQNVWFTSSSSLPEITTNDRADVLILCAALWKNVDEYPGRLTTNLQPRHIVLSHHDDIFQTNSGPVQEGFGVKLNTLLAKLQSNTSGCDRLKTIRVPARDALMIFD